MNRWIIVGVVVLGLLYTLFSSLFVITARDQAIVMRFGEITRVHTEPGIYFKIPTDIVETVEIIDKRLLRYDLDDITLQVRGGKFYNVDAFLTYAIVDPVLFRQTALGSLQIAEQRINTRFESALRQVYGLREFDAALSEQRTEMMRDAQALIRPEMAELGIEVKDVRILRTDLTDQVSQQTFDRMKAERQAEAALLRARGQEAAQTLRAVADRQAVQIVSEARRDSEILRGEGDATRSAIFAEAYGQNQEFFEFYRSMESYRTALSSTGTTMLLSPGSEFFQYFGEAGQGTVTGAPVIDLPTVLEVPASEGMERPEAEPLDLEGREPLVLTPENGVEPAPVPALPAPEAPVVP